MESAKNEKESEELIKRIDYCMELIEFSERNQKDPLVGRFFTFIKLLIHFINKRGKTEKISDEEKGIFF